MGPERAETMMKLVPPVGWGDVATRDDLERFQVATRSDLDQLQTATRSDLERLEARIEAKLEARFGSMQRTLVTWLIASQVNVIGIVGLFIAFN